MCSCAGRVRVVERCVEAGRWRRARANFWKALTVTRMAVFAHTQTTLDCKVPPFSLSCVIAPSTARDTQRALADMTHARVQKGHRAAALSLSSYFLNAKPHSTQILQLKYEEWPFGQSM